MDGYLCINHTKPVVGGLERPIPPQLWDDSRHFCMRERERGRKRSNHHLSLTRHEPRNNPSLRFSLLPRTPRSEVLFLLWRWRSITQDQPSIYSLSSPLLTPTGSSQPWPLPLHSRRVKQPSEERREGAAHSQESSLTHSLTHPPVHPFD